MGDDGMLTAMISCAFTAESFLRTRSTDCADASFLKPSRIVADVKSIPCTQRHIPTSHERAKELTTERLLELAQRLERPRPPIERLDVFWIELERLVAVRNDLFVLGRAEVDVARCAVAEEDRLGLRRDGDGARVEVDGRLEAVRLVRGVSSYFQRG